MFGLEFEGFDDGSGYPLRPLLLPEGFEGNPLRKSFVLAARVSKPWPGAKEPGESDTHAAPSRRKMLPPGVPDPSSWPRQPGESFGASAAGDADPGEDGGIGDLRGGTRD
jgi:NADH-quinone oxidoreductase subunit C